MKIKFLKTFLLLFLVSNIQAQKTSFDIIVKNKTVGEATITKQIYNDREYSLDYTFDASITILFIKTTVDMDTKVKYKDGQLVEANINYVYNGKLFLRNYVWNGTEYIVTTDGKKSTMSKKAFFSTMNLYEKEPVGVTNIFLEKQNDFAPVKSLGNNKYFIKVDGDDCTYTYKDGELQTLKIDAFVDLTITRKI